MSAVECATTGTGIGRTSIGNGSRGPRYFRAKKGFSSSKSKSSGHKSATERLEADKSKYVKSETALQRRFTSDLNPAPSPHNDSSGTHSMGTSSAGSPVMDDDDSGGDYTARDLINDFTFGHFTTTKDSIFRTSLRRKDDLYVSDYQPSRASNLYRSKTNAADDRPSFNKFSRSNSKPETVTNAVSSKYVSAAVSKFQSSNDNASYGSKNTQPLTTNSKKVASSNHREGGKSKLLSSYLSKAKEGIKAVTSTISGSHHDDDHQRKGRPSRAPKPKTQKRSGRSASVGAPAFRQENYLNVPSTDSDAPAKLTLSPRSQLKQVRQNLKKVSADYRYGVRDFNALKAANRRESPEKEITGPEKPVDTMTSEACVPSVTVTEKVTDDKPPVSPRSPVLKSVPIGSDGNPKSPTRSRPLSLIENQQSFLELQKAVAAAGPPPPSPSIRKKSQSSLSSESKRTVPSPSLRKKSVSSSVNDENSSSGVEMRKSKSSSRTPSLRLKRRSWDLSQTMDMRLQVSGEKKLDLKPTSLTPEADFILTSPLSTRKRRSWSKAPNSDRYNKDSSKTTEKRKSITEALEEIFNPLEVDDDMDTAYNSMSPDASMDCKTLVGNTAAATATEESPTKQDECIIDCTHKSCSTGCPAYIDGKSTGSLDDVLDDNGSSSRCKTPVNVDTVALTAFTVPKPMKMSRQLSTTSSHHSTSSHSPKSNHSSKPPPKSSSVTNRIDLAPDATYVRPVEPVAPAATTTTAPINNSPMCTPRMRREVAPPLASDSRSNSLTKSGRDEAINTMRSHNTTSSSASADPNKPLHALTASDLKPRRSKRLLKHHHQQHVPSYHPTQYSSSNGSGGRQKRPVPAPRDPTSEHRHQRKKSVPNDTSPSSTPYSSLRRHSDNSSVSPKHRRARSKSDVSVFQTELDRFFSTMGMDEKLHSPLPLSTDTLFTTAVVSSESDFSFAGASAYVRDSADEGPAPMEVDPITAGLKQIPSVSIIEKNARVMRWLMSCKKSGLAGNNTPTTAVDPRFRSPRGPPQPSSGGQPHPHHHHHAMNDPTYKSRRIPPPSPRVRRAVYNNHGVINVPKESDV